MTYSGEEYRIESGSRLRQERTRLGYTQQELADIGGVRKQAQLQYESGQRSPKAEYLALLQERGIDVQFVVTGAPSPGALASEEAELLRRFRAASPEIRAAVFGVLGTVAVPAGRQYTISQSEIGEVVQGDQTVTGPLTFNVGGKKRGKAK